MLEPTLNRAPVAIQENVERVNENAKSTVAKVNEVVTDRKSTRLNSSHH